MSAFKTLFTELDRCEFVVDYEYNGSLDDYTYNGISYAQGAVAYYSLLLGMYRDFLLEWVNLSEVEKSIAHTFFNEIKNKRYMYGSFFFDVPSREIVLNLYNDRYVPKKNKEMARFICDMAEQQAFFLLEVMRFLEGDITLKQSSKKTDIEVAVEILADYPDLLSTSEVAKIFSKTDYTIREWESKGVLINVAEDAIDDKGVNSNGHRKRRKSLLFRKSDIIHDVNLRAKLLE